MISACSSTDQKVVNYEAEGNLSRSKSIQCKPISQLSNKNNPVDIFTGIANCIENNNFQNAAELYYAGMSYGYYDTKRVSDTTAHQAISVLRMNIGGGMTEEQLQNLQHALDSLTPEKICPTLTRLGKPEYRPTYMIQHGLGAFTGQSTKDGLVGNFDPASAWLDSLSTIAKCGNES
ncbi:hypothetical protein [Motiliproteus sp. SC1-56]|uniref:hypothetical protein n=1 Tax=Motiliproteus sp. SC1-56 TaxID=2799565 RepID=UPI001F5C761C|nr:hypothetical protein [Motiliproteus sp. SC1-56]